MKKRIRSIPTGDLPYTDDKSATRMMVKLFEEIPFLANLPNASPDDSIVKRTLMNTPGVHFSDKKIIFDDDEIHLKQKLVAFDSAFNSPTPISLDRYGFDTSFLAKYYQIIERIKPAETVINLLGPVTISQWMVNKAGTQLLSDKHYRKIIIQAISIKALWLIHKLRVVSPDTKPLFLLEEPLLYKVGNLKRENEEVTQDLIVNMLVKIVEKIHDFGGLVGVQCFEKCDWKIPIDAGVDLISFDAYNNPNNLNIIPDKVNEFLAKGGRINWAIVPVMNENIVKTTSVDYIYDRLIKTMEGLIIAGTTAKLVYNRATVSVQGNLTQLPLFFAEKALITANQVGKRIPVLQ